MPQGSDIEQKEWLKNKGKGPSIIDLSNEVELLKLKYYNLLERVENLERMQGKPALFP